MKFRKFFTSFCFLHDAWWKHCSKVILRYCKKSNRKSFQMLILKAQTIYNGNYISTIWSINPMSYYTLNCLHVCAHQSLTGQCVRGGSWRRRSNKPLKTSSATAKSKSRNVFAFIYQQHYLSVIIYLETCLECDI